MHGISFLVLLTKRERGSNEEVYRGHRERESYTHVHREERSSITQRSLVLIPNTQVSFPGSIPTGIGTSLHRLQCLCRVSAVTVLSTSPESHPRTG